MALVGWILLALVVLVLGAVIVLIATPLHLRLAGEAGDGSKRLVLEARTLWGLTPPVRIVDTDRPGEAKTETRKAKKATRKREGRSRRGPAMTMERVQRLAEGVPGLVQGEFARVHLDRLALEARFGTGDPAGTGQLYGWLTPLIYSLPDRVGALRVVPDFDRACFVARGEAALHFTPVSLGVPVIRLAWAVFVRPS